MVLVPPRVVAGFRDLTTPECVQRAEIVRRISRVFETFGFAPLVTPPIDHADITVGRYGAEADRQITRFADGTQNLALRYDLTVPLARHIAQHADALSLPFKRYEVGPVFRAHKMISPPAQMQAVEEYRPAPISVRMAVPVMVEKKAVQPPPVPVPRELFQCDADIVGSRSGVADAECIALIHAVFAALGIPEYVIGVNNRKIYRGLQAILAIGDEGRFFTLLRTLNRLATMGADAVKDELGKACGMNSETVGRVFSLLTLPAGSIEERLAEAEKRFGRSEAARQGIVELRHVLAAARAMGVPEAAIAFDPFTTRSLDYYTSTVFKTDLPALPRFGSIASGGRYDDLVSVYLGRVVPAVGMSIRVDRLLDAMKALKLDLPGSDRESPVRVLVTVSGPGELNHALAVTAKLRAAGIPTECAKDVGVPPMTQARWAVTMGVPFLMELAGAPGPESLVTVRVVADGSEATVPLPQAIDMLLTPSGEDSASVGAELGHEPPSGMF